MIYACEPLHLWEQILDSIASGESAIADFLDDQRDTLEGMLEQLSKSAPEKGASSQVNNYPCPDCQKPLIRRQGKKGFWWGCSAYPDCKTTLLDMQGHPKARQALNI